MHRLLLQRMHLEALALQGCPGAFGTPGASAPLGCMSVHVFIWPAGHWSGITGHPIVYGSGALWEAIPYFPGEIRMW